ncbi:amidohydrolase family protein [Prosthecomicrobium pneumaticum]|uniref:L-fuconolactonase n=1 Tax=Prosthecomicrobium pneumaticum TaxID=81895 RepID=A0A7W9FPJ9_9HYPH|nr:amidohydrolase family protein [Prosthecomicrobium pneumaticum]MBB5754513.1 L-fuconolactonase [Prosthecomicrobium pneumaticum]
MPAFPIIDTHLHVWDQTRLKYSAFEGHPLFGHPYHVEDYRRDCGGLEIEAMVFLECYADFWTGGGQYLEEIAFVEEEAQRDPRIKAIVPMAPLEWGAAVEPMLAEMVEKHPTVKGIRRIVEFDADPRALTLSERFIEGVNTLGKFGLHFEINVNHTQMDIVRAFVKRIPNVPMILDHCGKPGIAEGALAQFRDDLAELAQHPNLSIKLSDLPVEADHRNWTEADLRPYIDATLESFGVERTIYGGDYPICLQATTMEGWVAVLDRALEGLSETELRKIYRDNANRFYRLGL